MIRRLSIVFVFTMAASASAMATTIDPIGCLIRCLERGVPGKDCAYICGGDK